MGNSSSSVSPYTVHVKTGDRKGAGTDATVKIRLIDREGHVSGELKLSRFWKNDHERGQIDSFPIGLSDIPFEFSEIDKLELWRDSFGLGDSWYLDLITIENNMTKQMFHFPAQRWIKSDTRYAFRHYDTSLPQFDDCPQQRNEELLSKKRLYEYAVNFPGAPAQVRKLPEDESFSDSYKWDIVVNKMNLLKESRVLSAISGVREYFESFGDLKKLYRQTSTMGVPIGLRNWTNDLWFGVQRIQGCNPVLLALATSIPTNLNVDPDVVKELLGGHSLTEAVEAKRVFIVDLKILQDLPCPEGRKVCSPIALFYLDEKKQDLLPLCIQLFQTPSSDNPVFYPTDPPYAWLLAKMWYNNADASYHQSCTHLGFTHLMMEGIAVCTHRNLSPSHPLFKLLAPHFLFLLAINTRGLQKLINPGGWVDKTTTMGCSGMFELIKRGVKAWRLDVHAVPAVECARRGVLDKTILPYYPYRDDAVAVFGAIEKYVMSMVEHFYDCPEKIAEDYELQSWGAELVKSKKWGGCGIKGAPGNGNFTTLKQIVDTMSAIISTCSLGHAAANFNQYDEYGFPPNYPGILNGKVPTQKVGFTEKHIFDQLPSRSVTLDTMVVTRLLSSRGTQALGDFEVQYLYDPVSVSAAKQLRHDLKSISESVRKRNQSPHTKFPYPWLDPDGIPNSISI